MREIEANGRACSTRAPRTGVSNLIAGRAAAMAVLLAVGSLLAAGALLTAGALFSAGSAFADDLPLVLTNDNIGMSGEEIEVVQGPDDFKDLDTQGPDAFGAEAQDDGILKLTEADLDAAAEPESVAGETSEFISSESEWDAAEEAAPVLPVEEAATDGAEVAESSDADACPAELETAGIASFEQCVEAAIRGGNGFGESSSVCRSLFPDEVAPTS